MIRPDYFLSAPEIEIAKRALASHERTIKQHQANIAELEKLAGRRRSQIKASENQEVPREKENLSCEYCHYYGPGFHSYSGTTGDVDDICPKCGCADAAGGVILKGVEPAKCDPRFE